MYTTTFSMQWNVLECLTHQNELHLFTLHFVYVPRINQTMQLFAQGHNRAPISTERGKSPLQLWISGAVSASNRGIDEFWSQVCFEKGRGDYYGVDWDGPAPDVSLDDETPVEVPNTTNPLEPAQ
ncbi:unnamed protein product [Pocillopora meandrina]|uniref:Integrase core domain-containing protein n=1 Tax=Pocillopora meandrina TaxID=46732 RepID=A0AAU9XHX2_9CNID|nr:unnamed protein product [Pocillopora meandrina]